MSAECNICGHDLAPDGIGLKPCQWCYMKKRIEALELEIEAETSAHKKDNEYYRNEIDYLLGKHD